MVRREGRPRRAAQARKQGPDRKSLVKYVDTTERTENELSKKSNRLLQDRLSTWLASLATAALHISKCAAAGWVCDEPRRER